MDFQYSFETGKILCLLEDNYNYKQIVYEYAQYVLYITLTYNLHYKSFRYQIVMSK